MKDFLLKSVTHFLEAGILAKITITIILTCLVYLLWPVFQFGAQLAFSITAMILGLLIWAIGTIVLFAVVVVVWTKISQMLDSKKYSITRYHRKH